MALLRCARSLMTIERVAPSFRLHSPAMKGSTRMFAATPAQPAGKPFDIDSQLRELADKVITRHRILNCTARLLSAPTNGTAHARVQFGEARMEMEDAHDSAGTTYYNDDVELCKELVEEVLDSYAEIVTNAPETDAKAIRQSWGLKVQL